MRRNRPALFKGRHFEAEIIVLCVRWYLRFGLSLRNLEEIMAERNLSVDHVTIWRWVQRYAPELNRRCRPELRKTNASWRCDETYLRVAGKWTYLYRAVDSTGATIDFLLSARRDAAAAKRFFQKALRSPGHPRPRVINVDGNPSYPRAIAELKQTGELGRRCRCRPVRYLNNIVEIVFTQMTKPTALTPRVGWDGVPDLDLIPDDENSVDEQFHKGSLLLKRRLCQAGLSSSTELLYRSRQLHDFGLPINLRGQLVHLQVE